MPKSDQYKKSIETLLGAFIKQLSEADIINKEGLDFNTLTKDNFIATGLREKDNIMETLKIKGTSKFMIESLIGSFGRFSGGKPLNINIKALTDAVLTFFQENAHVIEGVPELLETIKVQIEERKTVKK